MINPMVSASVLGGAAGVGTAIGLSKLHTKLTGKTTCLPGSIGHILTNDKLDKQAKADVIKEQTAEFNKGTLKLGMTAVGVGAAAALASAKSPKVATFFSNAKSTIAKGLSNISVNGNNLKDMIKGTNAFAKFNKLSSPAKVAIAVSAGVIALVAPLATLVGSQKVGYIEGKHETDTLKRSMGEMTFADKNCVAKNDGYQMGCVA